MLTFFKLISELEGGDPYWLLGGVVLSNAVNSSEFFLFKFESSIGSTEGIGKPAVAFAIKCSAFSKELIQWFKFEISDQGKFKHSNNSKHINKSFSEILIEMLDIRQIHWIFKSMGKI